MNTLAIETWIHCWNFCDAAELRRLSLVCRYFRTLCQPLLFHSQCVKAPHPDVRRRNWIKLTDKVHQTAENLKDLAASTHAASVREWQCIGGRSIDLQQRFHSIADIHVLVDAWQTVLKIFSATLGAYQRVTVLRLDDFTIDAGFRTTLESLGSLEDLSLLRCNIICRTGNLLPLKTFSITGWSDVPPADGVGAIRIVAPHSLGRLIIGALIDGKYLLTTLVGYPLPKLVYLSVALTARISDLFFACLEFCPQLECIHIWYDESIQRIGDAPGGLTPPDHLPSTILPVLNSFRGPFILAGVFLRDRPVNDVELSRPISAMTVEQIGSTLVAISHGSIPIRGLSIGASFPPAPGREIFALVRELFPELRILSIRLTDETYWPIEVPDDGDTTDDEDDSSSAGSDAEYSAAPVVPAPSAEQPGYMYGPSNAVHAPDGEVLQQEGTASPVTITMDLIHTRRILLPPHLQVLRFTQRPACLVKTVFTSPEQHRAVLMLEALLPALDEVAFSDCENQWLRDRHVWTRDSNVPKSHVWGNPGVKIISMAWNADGKRREETSFFGL
ncbi:hypothetical protein B0H10DRAFT_2232441 [Mycena sp. CBHHK59/15]|nr:hypothetical protein B0H10DRAFT_2232441 [Mycena sp. CBHHK59/15]